LKKMVAKVKFRPYLKNELLDLKPRSLFETGKAFMLEDSLKDSKTELYLLVGMSTVLIYGGDRDRKYSPGLAYIELLKSYPSQLPGRLLESLSHVHGSERPSIQFVYIALVNPEPVLNRYKSVSHSSLTVMFAFAVSGRS